MAAAVVGLNDGNLQVQHRAKHFPHYRLANDTMVGRTAGLSTQGLVGAEGSDGPSTLVNRKAETAAGPSAQPRRACGFGPSSENEPTVARCNRTGSLRYCTKMPLQESLQRALSLLARKTCSAASRSRRGSESCLLALETEARRGSIRTRVVRDL